MHGHEGSIASERTSGSIIDTNNNNNNNNKNDDYCDYNKPVSETLNNRPVREHSRADDRRRVEQLDRTRYAVYHTEVRRRQSTSSDKTI